MQKNKFGVYVFVYIVDIVTNKQMAIDDSNYCIANHFNILTKFIP